jgi:hypothetical protein
MSIEVTDYSIKWTPKYIQPRQMDLYVGQSTHMIGIDIFYIGN